MDEGWHRQSLPQSNFGGRIGRCIPSQHSEHLYAFNRKIVDIARRNVYASFDLATSLAGAKNLADIVQLQAAFWRKQFGVLTAQAEEVRVLSTKVTADAVEQVKGAALMNFARRPDGKGLRGRA